MAITGNNSSEKTVREKTIWTGLADCKVLAINPSKEELQTIGINAQNDQVYITDDGKYRVDVWVETVGEHAVKNKVSFWLENSERVSQAGKKQWINKYGVTAWYTDDSERETKQPWYLVDGVRAAYNGEEELHKFLRAYLNVVYDTTNKKYDECRIDDMQALMKGDLSELKSVLTAYPDNTVRVLWGAKVTDEGNVYQNTFNKFFEKTCVKPAYKNWEKNALGDYGFKADIQDSFIFQEFVGSPSVGTTADAETVEDTEEDAF